MIEVVFNADDFGFTRDVNDGILAGHREGVLGATTLMANGEAFKHAVELARANPSLDVGVHLTLIGGRAFTGGALPESLGELVWRLARGNIPVEEEFIAQTETICLAGILPTHFDTHKHTHTAPRVQAAMERVARRFRIPWIRRTLLPLGRASRCRSTDHFTGFTLTGRMGPAEMVRAIERLRPGFTEFMCHPGFCTDELRAAPTRLKESRARELEALRSPQVREALERRGARLRNYRTA